jgi:small subunit ribosomal protein S3
LGQKVNPIGLRLGIVKTWESRWYSDKKYAEYIEQDFKLRNFVKKKLFHAGISRIEIERSAKRIRLRIFTARPGIVIGKKGSEIERLKQELEKKVSQEVLIDIQEVRKPEIDAQLVAENVAMQIERRVAFRRAMKRGVTSAMRFGAQGIKDYLLRTAGRRRNGPHGVVPRRPGAAAHPARRHRLRFYRSPHNLRVVGVKVYIFKGEILKKDEIQAELSRARCRASPRSGKPQQRWR